MTSSMIRLIVLIGLFRPLSAHAQSTELRGKVVNESGAAVAGATITLSNIGYTVRTDSTGAFVLSGTPGSVLNLTLRATGFRSDSASVTLPRRAGLSREFKLLSETSAPPDVNPSDRLLRGRVIDTEGSPLSYASVQLNGGRRFIADDSGRFTMPSPSGQFSLIVRRIGFSPEEVKLEAAPDTAVRVRMRALAVSLPEQRITGRAAFVSLDLSGFYRRMRDHDKGINHGYFITPEDLELRKPNVITQMVEGLPGVYLRNRSARGGSMIVGSPCSELTPSCVPVGAGLYRCVMTVYLDGIRVVGRLAISPADIEKELVNELALPNTVAGMEVYPRGVGAPPEFQPMNGNCGVVLIWTK
jgi:hypothetical protein